MQRYRLSCLIGAIVLGSFMLSTAFAGQLFHSQASTLGDRGQLAHAADSTISDQDTSQGGITVGEYVATSQQLSYLQTAGWTQVFRSPNASFIKVHFTRFSLLPGDYLTVSDPQRSEVYTYYSDPTKLTIADNSGYTTNAEPGFWAMSVTGDTAIVQLHSRNEQRVQLTRSFLQQFGVTIDRYTRGFSREEIAAREAGIQSTCGGVERKDAVCYKTSHPTEWAKSAATAILVYNDGRKWCTAWRVGPKNHIITNNHCISTQSAVDSMETWFNYCRTSCGGGSIGPVVKVDNDKMIVTRSNLDMTLITINNADQVAQFGYYELDPRIPVVGEEIYIPQHGATNPREFGIESDRNQGNVCRVDRVTSLEIGYMCDTIGGSSGSAVLARSSHKVIALHHTGGCPNNGVRADLIWPVIRQYVEGTPTPTPVTPTPTPITRTPTPITRTPTPVTSTPTPVTTTPTPGAVFSDNFESDKGWLVNPNGSDTATSGQWERGDPEATNYNGPKQLGDTASGSNDLVTGRLAGSAVGDYDLDGGVTSIRSPSISLPSSGNLTLTFRYYLAHATNASSADYLRVTIVGDDPTRAAQTTVFEKLGTASDVDASWQTATVSLSSYAGQTIRIVIEAADSGTASLVEGAVDDITITRQ